MKNKIKTLYFILIMMVFILQGQSLEFPGPDPGKSINRMDKDKFILENNVLSYSWTLSDHQFKPLKITNRITGDSLDLKGTELFLVLLDGGETVRSSNLKVVLPPSLEAIPLEESSRHLSGMQLKVALATKDDSMNISWRAMLRDDSNVVRQEITIKACTSEIQIKSIQLVDLQTTGVESAGNVPGSPLTANNFFFAYEHPNAMAFTPEATGKTNLTLNTSDPEKRSGCLLYASMKLKRNEPLVQTSVIGVAPVGQVRRAFLYYIERERAHPYRPFLHYNAWYDICWDQKITEAQCLDVIEKYGQELVEKRKVAIDSFVWDDGWDDPKTLWKPLKENFPAGFSKILSKANQFNSTLGFWLSPFGGYGKPAEERYAYGKQQGFEFKKEKFALAGTKYYQRFLETCLEMMNQNGSNFFKFDGLTQDIVETEAMLRLTRELRKQKPDLFISITTGTWPSPFWLWYGDSTWRGADDMGFYGPGSKREQWITYRDMITYRNVVCQAPLYPLNSLMNQGIAQAIHGPAAELGDSTEEIRKEIRSFFACGTCLQELYISPGKMSSEKWDDLAEAAKWSKANSDVLVDTHWIGGDPGKQEIYGWAAWNKRKGIFALRNPSPESQCINIHLAGIFQLPEKSAMKYELHSPWKSDSDKPWVPLHKDATYPIELKPFEVVVYEAIP